MRVRPYVADDLDRLINLTIETFRPFYEDYVHPLYGDRLFSLHHGEWEQDYRTELPTLHDPARGRQLAVAEVDGEVVGFVAWIVGERPLHGQLHLLAVDAAHRRQHVGRALCRHALADMKANGVEVVEVGTGGDPFHAPARALYESLGMTLVPIAGYIAAI